MKKPKIFYEEKEYNEVFQQGKSEAIKKAIEIVNNWHCNDEYCDEEACVILNRISNKLSQLQNQEKTK